MATTTELPYTLTDMPVDDLLIDDRYQRGHNAAWIARTVTDFNMHLVGALIANRREDGRVYLIDGQQRRAVMMELGYTTVPVLLYEGLTREQEAEIFHRINRARTKVAPWYDFRARLVARERFARAVDLAISEAGFYLGVSTDDRDVIGAVRAVEGAFNYQTEQTPGGGQALGLALGLIKKCWHGARHSLNSEILRGLPRFVAVYNNLYDEKLVVQMLSGSSPTEVLEEATKRARYGFSHSKGTLVTQILVGMYNQIAPQNAQLDVRLASTKIRTQPTAE